MKKTILIINLLIIILGTHVHAQLKTKFNGNDSLGASSQQKKRLTPEDYKLWHQISHMNISDDGNWFSYGLWYGNYTDRKDTLFLKSINKEITFSFPTTGGGQFSIGSKWFGCLVPDKGLALVDLETDSLQWIPHTNRFEFSKDGRYLIGFGNTKDSLGSSGLWIMDLKLGKRESIPGVTEFLLHPTSNNLAYTLNTEEKKAVILRQLGNPSNTKPITENTVHPYKKLVWNTPGTALAFLEELSEGPEGQKKHMLYYYGDALKRAKLQTLHSATEVSLFTNSDITDTYLKISADGSAVFFKVQGQEDKEKIGQDYLPDEVQVWRANDKTIYPKRKREQDSRYLLKLAAWWPGKGKTMFLETDSLPVGILTGDRKHLLSYDPLAYAPHFKYAGDVDLYLTELETGRSCLFLARQSSAQGHTLVSPGGRYIAYFREGHWWVYDLEKKIHTNMTKGLGVPVYNMENPYPGTLLPYGAIGWTTGDKELWVYDQYDVWLLSLNGNKHQRLTKGREAQIRYHIDRHTVREGFHQRWFHSFEAKVFDLSEGFLLETLGSNMASGYSFWKPGQGTQELVYTDMRIDNLKKAQNREAYIYSEQSFDVPPRICYWEPGMREPKVLMGSNRQHKWFHWGRSELLQYPGPDGQLLQGVLFYPTNYIEGKKYPMIVHIYQRQSHKLHHYIEPSEYLQDGWNPTNYTAEGYFVFLPDIRYNFNDPGVSAVQCIEAGVKAVLDKGIVQEDRIGLIGHSFGGYEAAFTVTQTDLFATAVAGAAVTDLVSFYHSVGWNLGKDQIWRFEDHQWRFTDSFYQNPEAYLRNSPLHHAANITTPLLLWTGEEDYWLDWQQNIELYLGLRRLDRECQLLIYPDEGHAFLKPKNQADLTRRIKKWFDTYLKPEEKGEGTE